MATSDILGEVLINVGLLSREQYNSVRAEHEESGVNVGRIILNRGLVSELDLVRVMADKLGMAFIDIASHPVDLDAARLITHSKAVQFQALPVRREGDELLVAMAEPSNVMVVDDLVYATGLKVIPAIAVLADLKVAIERAYAPGAPAAPSGTPTQAAILFTDIVGSTKTAVELGDAAWRDLLGRHNAAVRAELARHDGHEVNTWGDAFIATFERPGRAIQAAAAIQAATRAFGVTVRAGVHFGPVEMVENDVIGIAVHVGARIAALAGGDEVLVSEAVRGEVAGSGLALEDRGQKELSGLPGKWQIYAAGTA